MANRKDTVTFIDNRNGHKFEYDILKGTVGPAVVDIGKFYADTGMFTYDPGFTSTGSCRSSITYIDGDQGILRYCGYAIDKLAENCSFLEVAYLLLRGELPDAKELETFESTITYHTMLHEQIGRFYNGFRRDSHPMSIVCGVVGAMASFYHDSMDINDSDNRMLSQHRLIAKMSTIVAYAYKYSLGQPFMYPRNELSYSENFLHMMFSTPCEEPSVNPVIAKAIDRILILHADHEQNASTSTVRLAGSSGANPFACIAAGVASLWGPAHGGANEAVLKMLTEIGSVNNIGKFVNKAKDKNDPFRLVGFGHRVYKNYDPRASILAETCKQVFDTLGIEKDPLLDIALKLEEIARQDEYFIEKKLYPNVDFYSGIIFKAIGIPVSMFTCLFALARTVGWVSHWNEMIEDPQQKIGRPRQLFTGCAERDYVLIPQR